MNLHLDNGFVARTCARRWALGGLNIALISLAACIGVEPDEIDILDGATETAMTTATGGAEGSESGAEEVTGDETTGQTTGDETTGNSTSTTGDGDGDPDSSTGGDGDPSSGGDGDGDPDPVDPLELVCTDLAQLVDMCTDETFDNAYADCIVSLEAAEGISPACYDARLALITCLANAACDPNGGDCMAEQVAEQDACQG